MRGLLDAGVEIDVFPIYPRDDRLWKYVPEILNEDVFPRTRVHHISLWRSLSAVRPWQYGKVRTFAEDLAAVGNAAARVGIKPLLKTCYVFFKAWAWADRCADKFDHILGYWGSYAGTCAYVFHRLANRSIPFSLFLHAGADLYDLTVYLREKLLYADRIITCTEFNRRYLEEHFPDVYRVVSDRIHLSYHGLDFATMPFQPLGRSPNRVIGVGGLEPYKGFDYLLRAAGILSKRGVPVEVEVVGDGSQREALESLAADCGIADKVDFRGHLPFSKVVEAMQRATMLVHPTPFVGDGLPNVIKEAMALGTPVVATNVAAIPEGLDYGNCGSLVPPKDPHAMARAIEDLLKNGARRGKLALAARHFAEKKFDLRKSGKALAAFLRACNQPEISCRGGFKVH
jgi:glycosyltransferase involved in cell wall biosynthesis